MADFKAFVKGFKPDNLTPEQSVTWKQQVKEIVDLGGSENYKKWSPENRAARFKNLTDAHPELLKPPEKEEEEREQSDNEDQDEKEKKKKEKEEEEARRKKEKEDKEKEDKKNKAQEEADAKKAAKERADRKLKLEADIKSSGVVSTEYLTLLDIKATGIEGLKKRLSAITEKSNLNFLQAKKSEPIDFSSLDFGKESANELLLLAYYCIMNGPVGVNTKTTWPFLNGTKSIKDVMMEAGLKGELTNGPWRAFCKIVQDNTSRSLEGIKNCKCMKVYGELWPDCNASFIAKSKIKDTAENESLKNHKKALFEQL